MADRAERRRHARRERKANLLATMSEVKLSDGRVVSVQKMRMRPEHKQFYEKMLGKALAEVQETSDPLVLRRTQAKAEALHEACEIGAFQTQRQGVPVLMEMPDSYRELFSNQAEELMAAIRRRREEMGVIE